jgi:3-deoxy-manno-octulosonate cytidylyltransferase (CMP-KDO synthetase)
VITSPDIANGTERAAATLRLLPAEIDRVVNLQGDAVLTPPWVIKSIIDEMEAEPEIGMFTPAVKMSAASLDALRRAKARGEVGGTTVVFDNHRNALYFSKIVIPFVRDNADVSFYRHIGLYGYRRDTLEKLVKLPHGVLEKAEQLEQLRALENGIKIRVAVVDYKGRSHTGIDSLQDLARAEKLIAAEGELLPVYDGSYTA